MATRLNQSTFNCLTVEWHRDVCVVSLRESCLDETWIHRMGEELSALVVRDGCRKMVITLSELNCLYSLLLGQLLALRRLLHSYNGSLKLAEVPELCREVFRVCCVDKFFDFADTREEALASLS
jgi:anti-anti-sigma factor